VGTGESLSVVWMVDVAAVVSANTIDFQILQSVNADLSAPTVLAQRRVLGANLTPGTVIELTMPTTTPTARYLGTKVLAGTGDTVTVSTYLGRPDHVQDVTVYAGGYSV
jgi:Bbp16